MIPCPSKWPRMAPFTLDMCPSIHSLIHSFTPSAFVIVVSDGNSLHSSHFCSAPKLTCRRRRNNHCVFQAQFVSRETIWAIVECRFQLHSDWKYLGGGGNRISRHLRLLPGQQSQSMAKGQMGEKTCTVFLFFSLPFFHLAFLLRCRRKKLFTVSQYGKVAEQWQLWHGLAWYGIGLSAGSNTTNFQWMDRCQSSQSVRE